MAQGWEETDKNARPIIDNEVAARAQKQQLRKGSASIHTRFSAKAGTDNYGGYWGITQQTRSGDKGEKKFKSYSLP